MKQNTLEFPLTCEASFAVTAVVRRVILVTLALSSVLARRRRTASDVILTARTFETGRTIAPEVVYKIHAGAAIEADGRVLIGRRARRLFTLVSFEFTRLSEESR